MKVLLADDDAFFRYSLRKSLNRWGYEVVIASNGNEAMQILQGVDPPRLAVMDWMMPGMDGIDVCRSLRARVTDNYVYIILITTKNKSADVIAGLDAQADDYLAKPFNLQELRARLQAGLRIVNLQAALASRQRELSHQATHDSLTGIWNRQAIIEILERETMLARQSKKPLCLAIADVDHFKRVNDAYGHASGDAVLTEAVRRMQSALRHFDNIGRYGGDEFIIVMPGLSPSRGLRIAERLRHRVAERPYEISKKRIPVSLSVGIAADTGTGDVGLLLRSADEALYRAKAQGRNQVEIGASGLARERRARRRKSV